MGQKRAIAIVIDALGVGALPDAAAYDDAPGANTLGNIDAHVEQLHLPNLERLGLGHILPLRHIKAIDSPIGLYGKMAERSQGKDTTTGHWEMMGIVLDTPFPVYPKGFPQDLIQAFIEQSGCQGILGNYPASGTEIIERLGEEHLKTGYPIVYTSADSVFQIAAHVEKIPLETLYHWCQVARQILSGPHQVSRVIARPFTGKPGKFERLGGDRRDFAIPPPETNCLATIQSNKGIVLGIGKIEDIFCQRGITHAIHTQNNTHGIEITLQAVANQLSLDPLSLSKQPLDAYRQDHQFIFVNLVDTDMKYGHRRDVTGYAQALEEIDRGLGAILHAMTEDDLLLITGDHGCDPTAPGSDHTREYVPIVLYSPGLKGGQHVGVRYTFADLGQTVLDWLNLSDPRLPGTSLIGANS